MSMVLGVVGDLFAEATNLDLSDADEVEQIAIQKAYQRIDTESRGKLGWREFKEIMAHLASSTATTAATSDANCLPQDPKFVAFRVHYKKKN